MVTEYQMVLQRKNPMYGIRDNRDDKIILIDVKKEKTINEKKKKKQYFYREFKAVYIVIYKYNIYIYIYIYVCVLWNDKRGHQLVTLKCIKGASTHSSFMLSTKWCMHTECHKYYVDIKF